MNKSAKIGLLAGLLLVGGAKINNSSTLINTKYNLEELIITPIVTSVNFKKIKQNDSFNIPKFEAVKSQESPKINFHEPESPEPPKYDGSKRLDKKTLDEFINFIYEDIIISEVIDKKFVKSVINKESERYVYAESEVGARGLMQLMPATWKQIEKELDFYKEAFNPNKNIEVGIKYLNWIHDYCEKRYPKWNELPTKNKHILIAAAYNGGINRLRKKDWNINKMPEETRNYVKKIEKDLNRNN